jgi:hypothetical protein
MGRRESSTVTLRKPHFSHITSISVFLWRVLFNETATTAALNFNFEGVHKWRLICREDFVSHRHTDVEKSRKRKKMILTFLLSTDMQNAYVQYVTRNQ